MRSMFMNTRSSNLVFEITNWFQEGPNGHNRSTNHFFYFFLSLKLLYVILHTTQKTNKKNLLILLIDLPKFPMKFPFRAIDGNAGRVLAFVSYVESIASRMYECVWELRLCTEKKSGRLREKDREWESVIFLWSRRPKHTHTHTQIMLVRQCKSSTHETTIHCYHTYIPSMPWRSIGDNPNYGH